MIPSRLLPLAAALALAGAAAPLAVHAQSSVALPAGAETRSFNLPPGPLDAALERFARTAGVNLSYEPALVAGVATRGITGQLGVAQALAALLAGTGLQAVAQPGGGYSLARAAASVAPATSPASRPAGPSETSLPTVRVTATAETAGNELPRPYAGGQVARGSRMGLLGNADVFETPFSTKAFTSELIRNQGARTVNDMVANDPSVRTSLSPTSPLDQSTIRGFLGNSDAYLFDGLEGLFAYSSVPVLHYERLEIFKGPYGGLVGSSGYGATVGGGFNLVPKRATDKPVRAVTFSVADRSLFGTHVDLGQRFGVDNQLGARLNVTVEDGRLYDDAKRRLIAPQIALDYRGDKVRATLDAAYVNRESSPLFNHWRLLAGAKLPAAPDPRVHPKPSWEFLDVKQSFAVLGAEWDFAENWTAHARHGHLIEEPTKRIYVDQFTIDGAGKVNYTSASSLLWIQDNTVTDVGLRGSLRTGSLQHKLSLGAVSQRQQLQSLRSQSLPLSTPVVGTLYGTNNVPNPYAHGIDYVRPVEAPALYLDSFAIADTVSLLDDRLLATVALRHQRIEKAPYNQAKVTPTLAALYKLGNGVSVYGNYAEALTQGEIAPASARNVGAQLDPYVSEQHEVGVKWDRGTHGITAAYFDIRKTSAFVDAADGVFKPAGRQRNKGFELETFGEPVRGVRVLGGVAWIDGRMARTANGTNDGKKAIGVPELYVNLGAEYDVAALPGLTLTGRLVHTGSAFADLANTQKIPAWRRVDVGARYAAKLGTTSMTLQAGIVNLLDKTFWTIGGRDFISVAPPRTWQVSASFDF